MEQRAAGWAHFGSWAMRKLSNVGKKRVLACCLPASRRDEVDGSVVARPPARCCRGGGDGGNAPLISMRTLLTAYMTAYNLKVLPIRMVTTSTGEHGLPRFTPPGCLPVCCCSLLSQTACPCSGTGSQCLLMLHPPPMFGHCLARCAHSKWVDWVDWGPACWGSARWWRVHKLAPAEQTTYPHVGLQPAAPCAAAGWPVGRPCVLHPRSFQIQACVRPTGM